MTAKDLYYLFHDLTNKRTSPLDWDELPSHYKGAWSTIQQTVIADYIASKGDRGNSPY